MMSAASKLAALVRRRFPTADGIRYGHRSGSDGDTVLWQVLRGKRAIWSAGPGVSTQIPRWDELSEAVRLLVQVVPADVEGDWLVLKLTAALEQIGEQY